MNQIFSMGGVTAAKGFLASGVHCGIKPNSPLTKKDLALIYSPRPCTAACVYTRNLVKGAPLLVTQQHVADGTARAILCNAGNANTCNADGLQKAEAMCRLAADALEIDAQDVLVASTGVIGQTLPLEPIAQAIAPLVGALSEKGGGDAAEAIMTTDTRSKECAVQFYVGGVPCVLGGMAKGSGMIHPNMATMLVFLTTDCAITAAMLQKALSADVEDSFNMVSVDGDTSTNDMVSLLANGAAQNPPIACEGASYDTFCSALGAVTRSLCRAIARDGEGASKLLECTVSGAPDAATAKIAAKSVITSSLVKTAMFGEDANWGRILCALGYAGCDLDVSAIEVSLRSAKGNVLVCEHGAGVAFSEEQAAEILHEPEIAIDISLHAGEDSATAWGCDLTHAYITINGDYRT